jgi:hypothetical protein
MNINQGIESPKFCMGNLHRTVIVFWLVGLKFNPKPKPQPILIYPSFARAACIIERCPQI